MKHSFPSRILSLVIAAQFLNVQVQASFATDAITQNSPEMQDFIRQASEKLSRQLSGKSERAIYRFAYGLFKKDVRGRNRLFKKTDEEFQASLSSFEQGKPSTADATDEINLDHEEQQALETVISNAPNTEHSISRREIKRETIIQTADSTLIALGAAIGKNGKLEKTDFETFSKKLNELSSKSQTRAPASGIAMVFKVILALIVLAVGLFGFLLVLSLAVWAGAINVYGCLILAAILIAEYFALKGIFSEVHFRHNNAFA